MSDIRRTTESTIEMSFLVHVGRPHNYWPSLPWFQVKMIPLWKSTVQQLCFTEHWIVAAFGPTRWDVEQVHIVDTNGLCNLNPMLYKLLRHYLLLYPRIRPSRKTTTSTTQWPAISIWNDCFRPEVWIIMLLTCNYQFKIIIRNILTTK